MSSRRLISGLVVVLGFVTAFGADAARRAALPALAVHYREALRSWFPPASAASLDEIDLSGAANARPTTLAFQAADHAVRRFAPLAVDATGKAAQTARLRRIAPILDARSARAARTGVALTLAAVGGSSGYEQSGAVEAAMAALRAAELTLVYATQVDEACPQPAAGRRATPSPTCLAVVEGALTQTSNAASSALAAGADRLAVVEASLQSLRDLARAPRPGRR